MPNKTKPQRDPRRDELRRLGERVREQRRSRGLTQEALAETLDLSVAYVSLIERGGRNPPYTTVVAIARALGVPTSRIVVDDGYIGEAYGVPTAAGTEALKLLARSEGIILDPVYTDKGLSGLIGWIRQGRLSRGDTVVFLHTGGVPALFAHSHQIAPALQEK